MAKRRRKSKKRKTASPNRPRSGNGPSGKRNGPDADRPRHNEGRKSEGRSYIGRAEKIADKARELRGVPEGEKDGRVPAVLAALAKSEDGPSRWWLSKRSVKRPGGPERCGRHAGGHLSMPSTASMSRADLTVRAVRTMASSRAAPSAAFPACGSSESSGGSPVRM